MKKEINEKIIQHKADASLMYIILSALLFFAIKMCYDQNWIDSTFAISTYSLWLIPTIPFVYKMLSGGYDKKYSKDLSNVKHKV